MGREQEIRRLKQIAKLVQPEPIREMQIVEVSDTSWMALVVMQKGNDRRFRCVGTKLYDEATIGDSRVA